MLSRQLNEVREWRGVSDLVAAPVITDTAEEYTTGDVFAIAGVATISKAANSSTEAHFYDNKPMVVISSQGADNITLNVSAIPLDVLAKLTGQYYNENTGGMVEGERVPQYFALGYKTQKDNGETIYVWRYKTMCNVPDQENNTINNGTDANGQELNFMGISTVHKFENNPDPVTGEPRGAKAYNVNASLGLADLSTFFDTVTTPDDLTPLTSYTLTISPATGYTCTVTRRGVALATGADIYSGDELKIVGTGSNVKVTVNGQTFPNGSIFVVTNANVTISVGAA
jgi:phi13 family phage major tail protein